MLTRYWLRHYKATLGKFYVKCYGKLGLKPYLDFSSWQGGADLKNFQRECYEAEINSNTSNISVLCKVRLC